MQIYATSQNFGIKKINSINNIRKERIIFPERLNTKRVKNSKRTFPKEVITNKHRDVESKRNIAEKVLNNIQSFIKSKEKRN